MTKRGLQDDLPDHVSEALTQIYSANKERNIVLVSAFIKLAMTLNSAGISPLPIKGMHLLLQGIYPDIGERIIGDIDVVVEPDQLSRTVEALRCSGYHQVSNLQDPPGFEHAYKYMPIQIDDYRNSARIGEKHIPVILDVEHSVIIEIHFRLCANADPTSEWLNRNVWRRTKNKRTEGIEYKDSSPCFHQILTFYHSQISHRAYDLGLIDYRHLLDMKYMLEHADWVGEGHRVLGIVRGLNVSSKYCLFLWQTRELIDSQFRIEHSLNSVEKLAIKRFLALRRFPVLGKLISAQLAVQSRLVKRMKFGRYRKSYGVIPLHLAVLKDVRYQFIRSARFFMRKTG